MGVNRIVWTGKIGKDQPRAIVYEDLSVKMPCGSDLIEPTPEEEIAAHKAAVAFLFGQIDMVATLIREGKTETAHDILESMV
jgi:hypothetical protein